MRESEIGSSSERERVSLGVREIFHSILFYLITLHCIVSDLIFH